MLSPWRKGVETLDSTNHKNNNRTNKHTKECIQTLQYRKKNNWSKYTRGDGHHIIPNETKKNRFKLSIRQGELATFVYNNSKGQLQTRYMDGGLRHHLFRRPKSKLSQIHWWQRTGRKDKIIKRWVWRSKSINMNKTVENTFYTLNKSFFNLAFRI